MRLPIIVAIVSAMPFAALALESRADRKSLSPYLDKINPMLPIDDELRQLNFDYASIRCASVSSRDCFELLGRSIDRENEGWKRLFPSNK